MFVRFRNQSIFNIIRWNAESMGETTRGPSVWCSNYYCFLIWKTPFNLFFYNFTKIIIIKKKLILWTSENWSMSCLAHWPSIPAYYIEDWLILGAPLSYSVSKSWDWQTYLMNLVIHSIKVHSFKYYFPLLCTLFNIYRHVIGTL